MKQKLRVTLCSLVNFLLTNLPTIRHMGGPVTMAAVTTLIPGLCMLPSRVLAYVQIGSFIIVLMLTSWCFATFFFQAFLRILGPSALSISIPEETCCGQRLKQKKKKQRETWHQTTKVTASDEKQLQAADSYDATVNHDMDLRNGEMKTFAVSIESNITQVSTMNMYSNTSASHPIQNRNLKGQLRHF